MKRLLAPLAGLGLVWMLTAAVPPPLAGGGSTYTVPAQSGSAEAARRPRVAEITFTDAGGAPQTLSSRRGRTVLVTLWATSCAPCIKQMGELDRLQERLGRQGFEVLALAQGRDGAAGIRRFYEQQGIRNLKIHLDPDGQAARALGARGIPTSVLVDARGRVAATVEGAAAWNSPEMVAALRQVMAGQ